MARRGLQFTKSESTETIYSVTSLTKRIKFLLEGNLTRVTLEGEIGQISIAPSGHIYLTLKDSSAQIDAVIWKSVACKLKTQLSTGKKVRAAGSIEVYEPRGRYQITCTSIVEQGVGDLQQQFLERLEMWKQEGLFDDSHKKAIPKLIKNVGIVTSPTGAAIQDMLRIFADRDPSIRLIISPCQVQGQYAANDISAAIKRLEKYADVDVMIVGRGGGSLEDLWAFNEEEVIRTVYACSIPIVSAVGHEPDFTLIDFVSDVRAPTPTAAAQMLSTDKHEKMRIVAALNSRLEKSIKHVIKYANERLKYVLSFNVIKNPYSILRTRSQRVDSVSSLLFQRIKQSLTKANNRLSVIAARFESLNPLSILARGFTLTTDKSGKVIRSIDNVTIGETIRTQVGDGIITSTVNNVNAHD